MINESYIGTANASVQDILYTSLYNMSFLLEDVSGKIYSKSARFITRNLKIDDLGSIQNFPTTSITFPSSNKLGVETQYPVLSSRALETYNKFKRLDSSLVEEEGWNSDIMVSNTLLVSSGLGAQNYVSTYMSYAYLEMYCLFKSLVEYDPEDIFGMTLDEIDIIISNIKYMVVAMGKETDLEVYDVLYVLKRIQKTILIVRSNIELVLG